MKNQIVGLKTAKLRSFTPGMGNTDTAIRPHKKRVFTEDELQYLHSLPTLDLLGRIEQGDFLIEMLNRPEIVNMVPRKANEVASNLKFQQDAIREIIKARPKEEQAHG